MVKNKISKFEKISRKIAYIIAWINIIVGWIGGILGSYSKGTFTMFVGLIIILSLNGRGGTNIRGAKKNK